MAVTIQNVDGDVSSVVRGQAENLRANWVVMTTHARGTLGRFWLGSVADEWYEPFDSTHPSASV